MSWWENASREGWSARCEQQFIGRSVPKKVDAVLRDIDERWATSMRRQQLHGESLTFSSVIACAGKLRRHGAMTTDGDWRTRW